jgi:phosphate-selective porin OprO/OprP
MKNLSRYYISTLLMLFFGISAYGQQITPTLTVNGRIQYDFEATNFGEISKVSNEFRRIHLSASGKAAQNIKYKLEIGFFRGKLGLRDMYLGYKHSRFGSIFLGSKVEPTSLDMMTSSKYIPFAERSMLSSFCGYPWASGLHYQNFDLFNSHLALQAAYTFNGTPTSGFWDDEINKGGNFTARITGKREWDSQKDHLVHWGVNYGLRSQDQAGDFVYRFWPENHTGEKIAVSFEEGGQVIKRQSIGLETAVGFKSLSVQGEFKHFRVKTDEMNFDMHGYYVFAGYFLTGEHRPYKNGAFGRVTPDRSIDEGGLGALEILARYSVMDTKTAPTTFYGVEMDGKIKDVTVGVNWYLTSHVRLMYNFVHAEFGVKDPVAATRANGHTLRVQADF